MHQLGKDRERVGWDFPQFTFYPIQPKCIHDNLLQLVA